MANIFPLFVPNYSKQIDDGMLATVLAVGKSDLLRIDQTSDADGGMFTIGGKDLSLQIQRCGIRHVGSQRSSQFLRRLARRMFWILEGEIATPILQMRSASGQFDFNVAVLAIPVLVLRRICQGVIGRALLYAALHFGLHVITAVKRSAAGLLRDVVHGGVLFA